jgi:tetratricopeptide (TPR) repeat protein
LVAFVGSYATEELDYKPWTEFLGEQAERLAGPAAPSWVTEAIDQIRSGGSHSTVLFDLVEEYARAKGGGGRAELAKMFALKDPPFPAVDEAPPYHIIETLGINRVITTNYDLEFEWMWFTSSGERSRAIPHGGAERRQAIFEEFLDERIERGRDAFSLVRQLPDGRSANSDVFDRDRPDRLIEFAVGSPDYEAHVMHLHGRVTDPETLVVSLQDYQKRYRRSGISKLPFEHAQKMLFAGNPILFVGLGMNEDVITATLEQFVSDHPTSHLARAFILWSPEMIAGKPHDKEELRRLSWYTRFGVLTIFDCELEGFRDSSDSGRLSRSIQLLGGYAKERVLPFRWEQKHFRTMQKKIDKGGSIFHVWENLDTAIKTDVFSRDLEPDRKVFEALFRGPPVKAFVAEPGSGHGYLAKVIADAFIEATAENRHVCSIINANFACEVDTAFALLSGLYDSKTASKEKQSRRRSLDAYDDKLLSDIGASGTPRKNILVIINGMDRFFDTSGYPLSNELDMAMRRLFRTYRRKFTVGGKSLTLHDWAEAADSVNPYSIILLGTPRVARFLEGLALNRYKPGEPAPAVTADYRIMDSDPIEKGRSFVKVVANRYRQLHPDGPDLPIEASDESAYLSAVREAFKDAGELPLAQDALIGQASRKRRGNQRHAVLGAYLNTSRLALALKDRKNLADLCLEILSTMAFIGQPVEEVALIRAPRVRRALERLGAGSDGPARLHEALEFLRSVRLVLAFECFPGCPGDWSRYGLHRAVMAEIRDRYGVPISDAKLFGGFNVSLFASQPIDDYTPEDDIHKELGDLVDEMLEAAERDRLAAPVSAWLRAALSIMRSYFTTSTLLMYEPPSTTSEARNAPLSDHAERLGHLIRLAEETAAARRTAPSSAEGPEAFFADDLVWLHNERGVVKLAQGDLYEARHAFVQALRINADHVEFKDRLQNWRSIQINQLHLDVERAKLGRAESRILEIEQAINEQGRQFCELDIGQASTDAHSPVEDIIRRYGRGPRPHVRVVDPKYPADLILSTGLVTGYRGLCGLLRGQMRTAEEYMKLSIEILRNIGEHRAYAMFQKHYSALQFAIGMPKEARATIKLCIAAANSSRQMDISHLAFTTETDQRIAGGASDSSDILPQLIHSLRYAVATDMYRVRLEVRKALAYLRMMAGDYDGALEHVSEAMSVAMRYGFSLRKISLRILIGKILIRRGDPESGYAVLEQAARNADRVGYQRAVELTRDVKMRPDRPDRL